MSDLEIKVSMLETLYNLAEKGKMDSFRTFRKYVIAIKDDIPELLEKVAYKNAIDRISLAMISFEVDDFNYAKEAVDTYKRTMDWLHIGKHLSDSISNKRYLEDEK